MRVTRDGAVDALHTGHVAVTDRNGRVLAAHGDPATVIYPRSAVKPFQAAAAMRLAGCRPHTDEIAVMAASHVGGDGQQAAVVRLLDRAGLSSAALRCPPALPTAGQVRCQGPEPTRLAHNCSGKHAGFLLATVRAGDDPSDYLDPDTTVQRAVLTMLRSVCGTEPQGPGVDGCGAPAWRVPLASLALAFAALAVAEDELADVATAMRTRPDLVAGPGVVDTELMGAERAVIAKRGAEGTLGFVVRRSEGPVGVAIKVGDGNVRAVGPVAVAILERLGVRGPSDLRRPAVLGGGEPRGAIEVAAELERSLAVLG